MPEKKRRNPFEDHINSESFDVSRLDNAPHPNELEADIQEFLESFPQPLNHELWDSELDDRQKMICAYLTTELVEQVIRGQYGEELQDISDDQLVDMLMIPVTLAMLAEERLHEKPPSAPPAPTIAQLPVLGHTSAFGQPQSADFTVVKETVRHWWQRTKDFVVRLFRRR